MERILFVDDDANLLAAYQRQLRHSFFIDTAQSGQQGLQKIKDDGPFAVIVSDYRMPGMDGVQFLAEAKEKSPESVRILFTGYADLETAIGAVNEGNIFRLLTKPCPPELLTNALEAAVKQYRLVMAERELLDKTLRGCLKVLSDVLSLLNPDALGRASRITRFACQIATEIGESEMWQIETAAMLSQIGCIILPEDTFQKVCKGEKLNPEESQLYNMHVSIASDLIAKIPRMENIAKIILYQEKNYDGSGIPPDPCSGENIPLGSRILKVCLDFDALIGKGLSKGKALNQLRQRTGWYDPQVLIALEKVIGLEAKYEVKILKVQQLKENMILAEDVRNNKGVLLITKDQVLTRPLLFHLQNFAKSTGVKEPIRVLVPISSPA
jgi:response regulator RpfG family c-di-GMP phosphodiesterase